MFVMYYIYGVSVPSLLIEYRLYDTFIGEMTFLASHSGFNIFNQQVHVSEQDYIVQECPSLQYCLVS